MNINHILFLRPDPCTRTAILIAQKVALIDQLIRRWDKQADDCMSLTEQYRNVDTHKSQLMNSYVCQAIDWLAKLTTQREDLEKSLSLLNPQFPKA